MSYNKYKFQSYQQFKTAQDLAIKSGYKTAEEFEVFLELFYSSLKK